MTPAACPICNSSLADDAVLCIQCGYHLQRKQRVHTETSATRRGVAIDANPYTPTMDTDAIDERRQLPLDDQSAQRASSIANDAFAYSTTVILVFLFMCPVWIIVLPYAMIRFGMWCHMRRQYYELRHPNSLSPYADIAIRFDEARNRYLFAIGLPLLALAIASWVAYANSR